MSGTLGLVVLGATLVWIAHMAIPAILRVRLFAHLTIGLIVCTGLMSRHFPVRIGLAFILILTLISCYKLIEDRVDRGETVSRAKPFDLMMLSLLATGVVAVTVSTTWRLTDPSLLDTLFRYCLLFPLAIVVGRAMISAGVDTLVQRALIWWTSATAVAALGERLLGNRLIPVDSVGGSFVREGNVRAVVFAEHALVLAVLLLVGVAASYRLLRGRWRLWLVALQLAGIWSTGSRGPMLLAVAYLAVRFVGSNENVRDRLGSTGSRLTVGVLCLSALVFLVVQGGAEGQIAVTGGTPAEASASYRLALFKVMTLSLGSHPLGWGLGGLPAREVVISSPFGPLDVSTSIDSELVLLATEFGYLGILAFIATVGLSILAASSRMPNADPLLLICAAGLFLALHAWAGLGTIAFMFVGLVTREVGIARERARQTHANARHHLANDRSGT